MQDDSEQKPPGPKTSPLDREGRAEIVDRLYEVALDPIRMEELIDVWEGHLSAHRSGPVSEAVQIEDDEINAHLARASIFLDRFEATRTDGAYRSVLEDIPRSAAFLSDGGSLIAGFNRAASVAFGLDEGATLADLPFEPEDIEILRNQILRVASRRGEKVVTLRMRSTTTGSPVIVRVGPVDSEEEAPLALVISTELVWPEGFADTVQDAFGLTAAEVEIVRGITLGQPIRMIAEVRNRSPETVKTQLRSILAKTETHSQSELIRVVLGLMDVSQIPTGSAGPLRRPGGLANIPLQTIRGPGGRRLDFLEFGAPQGRPVLYMHLDYGLIRWPAPAEAEAAARGLRIIVPVRAGYGASQLHAKGTDHITGVAEDYLAVLDHLGVRACAVLCLGADLRFALKMAEMRPGLLSGILGCAALLPLKTAAQYERMDKWQRFILANARYAPKVLPFLVKAGFSLARRLGKEKFFAQVNGGSPADMECFARPDVRAAMLLGSDLTLHPRLTAHEAFTRECISSERDWSDLVRNTKVPVILLQGDQDPQTPVATVHELMQDFPNLDISFVPNTGQLLFFAEWPRALDTLETFLPRS